MGQSYSLNSFTPGSAGLEVPELAEFTYEKSLGVARFLKSIRACHRDGLTVVKVIMKPYPGLKLDPYVKAILRERNLLKDVPNALAYQRIVETEIAGYIIRQFIYSSLYDRMSTRPFLEDIEKKWIAFQLLCALRDCHAQKVFHGDIKTENVLVTSWNWLYLTDFSSSFKPTFLPVDNPADYAFYFDTSERRTCYLAPERFLKTGETPGNRSLNWAMDIFSAGCVIAELFLESPIFNLSQLYKYREGEYSPQTGRLLEIEDENMREMITHMIHLEPESRYSAEECLDFWRRKGFPEYFYGFLHQYMGLITEPSPSSVNVELASTGRKEADERINRIFGDFDKISYFLRDSPRTLLDCTNVASPSLIQYPFPLHLDLPKTGSQSSKQQASSGDGALIFLTLVAATIRNTTKSYTRVKACDILLAFAEKLSDEAKLDRILPFVVLLLGDSSDGVKIAGIRTLAQLLAMVNVVSPVNAYVFSEYIFPRLRPFIESSSTKPSPAVRAAYASSIASLAQSSLRVLDMVQALGTGSNAITSVPTDSERIWADEASYHAIYDVARADLLGFFEIHSIALLTDSNATVRRALLGSVSGLCIFFGNPKANEVILSHLNTYLNDKDWILKCAFFEAVVGVATFVGSTALEEFILPLMIQSLTDPEEFVVERVLRSLARMSNLGLFQRSTTWDLLNIAVRFFVHPSIWIRDAAIHFVVNSTTFLAATDKYCIVSPLVRPFLKINTTDISAQQIFDSLKKPLSKNVYDMLLVWSTNADKSVFWRSASKDGTFSFDGGSSTITKLRHRGGNISMSGSVPRNEGDNQWMTRLKSVGMTEEDEFKLLALREYIWRVAMRRKKAADSEASYPFAEIVSLSHHDITPQTVLFDKVQGDKHRQYSLEGSQYQRETRTTQTIADALLDASTTIDSAGDARSHNLRRNTPTPRDYSVSRRGNKPNSSETGRYGGNGVPSPNLRPESNTPTNIDRTASTGQDHPEPSSSGGKGKPDESSAASSPGFKNGEIKHQPSALNLLSRQESAKAYAAIATTSTNAIGKLDAPLTRMPSYLSTDSASEALRSQTQSPRPQYKANHTYQGNDPTVLRLLDNVFAENYPTDLFDFGPVVSSDNRITLQGANGKPSGRPWRPTGVLVAAFGEHTAAINQIAVAPDHCFFVTGSDDGTVKGWETARLERNVTPRPRLTYRHAPDAKVKCVMFVENTYTFISTATDGSVHAVKVERQHKGGAIRYGKFQLLREYHISPQGDEYALWIEHYRTDLHSLLLMATNRSRIIALDLKSMSELYSLQNPIPHGMLTTFCIDRKRNWLLVGTSHGILDLWDIRFQVRVKAWGVPGGTPIHRLTIHPMRGRGRWVCIVGGGNNSSEIIVWDIDRAVCKEVYRVSPVPEAQDVVAPASREPPTFVPGSWNEYKLWDIDDDKPESMLDRFASNARPDIADPTTDSQNLVIPSTSSSDRNGIRALAVGLDYIQGTADGSKCGFLLSAGADRTVRFWDVVHPDASKVVSGPDPVGGVQLPTRRYEVKEPLSGFSVTTERTIINSSSKLSSGNTSNKKSSATSGAVGNGRSQGSVDVNVQQHQLLGSHLDSILDIALIKSPYAMVVSVDRSGMIYVFQ